MLSKKMREIKFKGKRKDNGKWITGSETFIRDGDGIWLSDEDRNVELVDEATVGQFTGIKDKNGVEIYEGDTVKVGYFSDSMITTCYFDKDDAGFFLAEDALKIKLAIKGDIPFEIIGNIHENPELLERKK